MATVSLKRRLTALERSLPPENIGLKLLTRVIREYDTGDAETIDGLRAEIDAAPAEDGQLLQIARALLEVDTNEESTA